MPHNRLQGSPNVHLLQSGLPDGPSQNDVGRHHQSLPHRRNESWSPPFRRGIPLRSHAHALPELKRGKAKEKYTLYPSNPPDASQWFRGIFIRMCHIKERHITICIGTDTRYRGKDTRA